MRVAVAAAASAPTSAQAPTATHLPDVLIVGPQKAGTTWIHDLLAARGDIALPRQVKETFFFDRHWDRGVVWYGEHFGPGPAAHRVEVAPTYFHGQDVPARVAATLGRIPVIVTLRDPVRRVWSLYVHMRRYGMTKLPFHEALARHSELLDSSRYATHLRRWREAVGEDNVHVLLMDDLRRDPHLWADRLAEILRLPRRPIPQGLYGPVNEASMPASHAVARTGWRVSMGLRSLGLHGLVEAAKKLGLKRIFFGKPGGQNLPEPDPAELARLRAELMPEIVATEELTGLDLEAWKS